MDKLRFISFSSGSDGNCYFLGNTNYGILIDAGIGPRVLKKRLKEIGLSTENIMGVFITHDHYDHIKGVLPFSEVYHLPIFTTETIFDGINHNYRVKGKLFEGRNFIEKGVPVQVRDFTIEAFEVPHDGHDNVGYHISYDGKQFVIATDLGHIEETQAKHFKEANILVIESNYDLQMLENNDYSDFLKERIAGKYGHLCNDETANFIAENCDERLTHVFLCHLSSHSNTPEIAYQCISQKLCGKNINITILPRTSPCELVEFE